MARMGLDFGLDKGKYCKKKFRWLMIIDGVSAPILPPWKGSRPNLAFKEMEIRHLNEDIYYPMKPDWKPINLVLYDVDVGGGNPVWKWIQLAYNPNSNSKWSPVAGTGFLKTAVLKLFDGCGNTIEQWEFEESWPAQVNFQTLDMSSNELAVIDITLRYARAKFIS